MTGPASRLRTPIIGPIIGLIACAGALCSCSASASGDSLTVYSGQHPQTTQQLVSAFQKDTGIKVALRSDDEGTLANQIGTEGSRSPADVFYTGNTLVLQHLREQGLLGTLPTSTLSAIPGAYDSPQGAWVGVSARVSVLVYNPSLIAAADLPTSVLQMADTRYQGKLALAPGETDFQPVVASVATAYGRSAALSWLKGLKANAGSAHSYPSNETISDQVNRGAVAFGLVNQYYWYRLKDEVGPAGLHSQIALLAPRDPGYVLDVSGAGVLKSSRHPGAAQRFVAFLVSTPAQQILAHSISYEYPLAPGVVTAAPQTPLDQLQPAAISLPQLGDGSVAVDLLRSAGLL